MKIKSEKEFWNISNSWYRRRHWLIDYSNRKDIQVMDALRAYKLALEMSFRMKPIIDFAIALSMPPKIRKFESGGINYEKAPARATGAGLNQLTKTKDNSSNSQKQIL